MYTPKGFTMARKITPLNDTQIRKAKPEDSRLKDGNGLITGYYSKFQTVAV